MEYVYAALLLHKAGQEVNEDNVKKTLEAAGVSVDEGRVKALMAALEDVDIDEAVATAAPSAAPAAAPAAPAAEGGEEPKEEEEENDEAAAEGLGALFG